MSKNQSVKSRIIIYTVVAILFVIASYFIAMSAIGYRYYWKNGKITRQDTGAIILSSRPGDARIYLNNSLYKNRTPLFSFLSVQISDLLPGKYKIGISKQGYVNWEGFFVVDPKMVTWATQILLLPEKREASPYSMPSEIETVTVSPDHSKELVITHDKQNSAIAAWQIDTTTKTNSKLFEKYLADNESWQPQAYSFDNKRILILHSVGDQKSYVVFDANANGNNWDITDTFKTSFDSYIFNPRNHDEIFGLRSGDMFRISYTSKNLSGVLYSKVRGIYPDGTATLMFVQTADSYVNLYRLESNNSQTLLVRGITDSPTYQIADISADFGYAVLPSSTKTLVIYKSAGNPDVSAKKIAENVDSFLPSPKNQYLGYVEGGSFYCYENGKDRYYTTFVDRKFSSIMWFNDQFNLGYIENGKLKMITYSGYYDQNMFDASDSFPVVLSPDAPRVFFVGQNQAKKTPDLFSFEFNS